MGYTAHPSAIIVVQHPDELGLHAYPRSLVSCSLSISSQGGKREIINITRWLVQLGFGPQVERVVEVHVATHMSKMTAHFSVQRGWPDDVHPAKLLTTHLGKFVSDFAIDQIQPRMNGTFAFLCHTDKIDTLLKASGQDGISAYSSSRKARTFNLWSCCGFRKICRSKKPWSMPVMLASWGLRKKVQLANIALRFRDVTVLSQFCQGKEPSGLILIGKVENHGPFQLGQEFMDFRPVVVPRPLA